MRKPSSFLYLFITSSLALGLMSCNKKLQSNPALTTQAPIEENLIPADEPTGEQADITPDMALSPTEPQYDTTTPEPTTPKTEPTPAKKTETPAPEKKTPTKPAEPAQPVVKKEEPKKTTTPQPPVKKTPPVVSKPPVRKVEPVKPAQPTKPVTPAKPVEPSKPVVKKEEPKPTETKPTQPITASNFIVAAYNTMVNEGKKIGPACNFYVRRVLDVLGFKTVDFLANDFDVAAKKMFKSYKLFTFTDVTELKRHIWSYRDRTGFIFHWERVGAPGHIAIVERVGETLYIYQASLNKYTARVDKTTLERLLLVNKNKGVHVYSDLQK